jgi:limonene-1,2-epoxide hydrolase
MRSALITLAAVMLSSIAWAQPPQASATIEDGKMSTPIEIVKSFCAAFPEDDGKVAIRRYFTPQTVWIDEGISKTTGIDEAIAFLERPNRSKSVAAVRFDMLAIAADGNRVLTERLDRFVRADGSEIDAIRVMGIFEVEGNHIVAWRDYADVNAGKNISADKR